MTMQKYIMASVRSSIANHFTSQKAIREPPSKFISTEIEVQLACRLLFVDMEGLNDGRAVKTIVPRVNPRKMVSFCFTLPRFFLF